LEGRPAVLPTAQAMSLVSWRKVEKFTDAQAVLVGVAEAEAEEGAFAMVRVVKGDLQLELSMD